MTSSERDDLLVLIAQVVLQGPKYHVIGWDRKEMHRVTMELEHAIQKIGKTVVR